MTEAWRIFDADGADLGTVHSLEGVEYHRAEPVDRVPRGHGEGWGAGNEVVLTDDADFHFKREIDAIAAVALNPRPVVADLHRQQAIEAEQYLAGGDGPFPHLSDQAEDFGVSLRERAEAVMAGVAKAATDLRAVKINTARQRAKADVRAADSVEAKAAVVVAFREALAAI